MNISVNGDWRMRKLATIIELEKWVPAVAKVSTERGSWGVKSALLTIVAAR